MSLPQSSNLFHLTQMNAMLLIGTCGFCHPAASLTSSFTAFLLVLFVLITVAENTPHTLPPQKITCHSSYVEYSFPQRSAGPDVLHPSGLSSNVTAPEWPFLYPRYKIATFLVVSTFPIYFTLLPVAALVVNLIRHTGTTWYIMCIFFFFIYPPLLECTFMRSRALSVLCPPYIFPSPRTGTGT